MHDYVANFKKDFAHLDDEVVSAGESIIKAFENPKTLELNHLFDARQALLDRGAKEVSSKARDNILKAILDEDYNEALILINEEIDNGFERRGY